MPSHGSEDRNKARSCDTHGDVHDTPDAALAILLKDGAYLVALREVACVAINLGAVLVLLGGICWQRIPNELRDAREGLWVRVVEVVDGNDFVPARALEGIDDVGACMSKYSGQCWPDNDSICEIACAPM